MDGSRFDDLTRALGQGISRRKVLRGLAGIIAGGTLAHRGVDAAGRELVICHATGNPQAPFESMTIQQAEFNLHARHGDYLRVECCADIDCSNAAGACGSGVCQNGYCVQLPIAAGSPCDTGLACTDNGTCDGAFNCIGSPIVCAETDNPCTTAVCSESGGGCREVPIDDGTTCGAGNACADRICRSGSCVSAPKTSCTGNCADCGGACVDLNSDPNNCQTCGHICDGGSGCTIATCNRGACGTASIDEGSACGAGDACDDQICASGICVRVPKTTCIGNCHACDGACVDLNTDPNNCQTCGHRCGGATACTMATCSQGSCGTTPSNQGGVCPMPNGDTGRCDGGQCINTCPMGTSCLFDPAPNVHGALGVCANGACACKPDGAACDCTDFRTIYGCCSFTCLCQNGNIIGTCV